MKVFALNLSDSLGGAARAAYRIHQAVRSIGIESTLIVNRRKLNDVTVLGPKNYILKIFDKFRSGVGVVIKRMLSSDCLNYESLAIFPTFWSIKLRHQDIDLVHLHWINGEMISIGDLGSIEKPLVWTLHDMWAFSGAEHYSKDFRWKVGYTKESRPKGERGFDLNRWTWNRKKKAWKRKIQIVTPSHWLARCVRESKLMHDWPVEVIPNPIDTTYWKPLDKKSSREKLNLPIEKKLILFGAIGGIADPRKGFRFLQSAIEKNVHLHNTLQLVIFGQDRPVMEIDLGIPVIFLGHISDESHMQAIYSAADMLVAPSMLEIFGQTASEAHACGCPVVGFENTGLADIIDHKKTGYLAHLGDAIDLANGINWVLSRLEESKEINQNARARAEEKFSYPVVARQYRNIYMKTINAKN